MNWNVISAVIGLVSGLLGASIALFGKFRLSSLARREAEAVLARYREPLVGAEPDATGTSGLRPVFEHEAADV